jgi:hypothetical protein
MLIRETQLPNWFLSGMIRHSKKILMISLMAKKEFTELVKTSRSTKKNADL